SGPASRAAPSPAPEPDRGAGRQRNREEGPWLPCAPAGTLPRGGPQRKGTQMALQRRRRERGRELSLFEDWLPSLGSWMRLDELIRDPEGRHLIRVEEFAEDGELVVRAELPGIDPDKDVEVTVDEGV